MCAVCGLPTTHSNLVQALGWATLISFTLTTFLGAWWIVTSLKVKDKLKTFLLKYKEDSKKYTKIIKENGS